MAKILVVGGATLDIINEVTRYPTEDSEIRALAQRVVRGGNAANTAAVLAMLGHEVLYLGTLADDAAADLIRADLASLGVDSHYCPVIENAVTPTSYVLSSREAGTRSIVHYRQLPELSCRDFMTVDLQGVDWVHFEGRNVENLVGMVRHLRQNGHECRCSLEVEKPRQGIEVLFADMDLLLFSKVYAQAQGFSDAQLFLQDVVASTPMVCAWGEEGAAACQGKAAFVQKVQTKMPVVDTLAAGDVLNAGIIDGLSKGQDIGKALAFAVGLAGSKCQVRGLREWLVGCAELGL